MKKLFSILFAVVLVLSFSLIPAAPVVAAMPNADYHSHGGNIYPTGGTIAEAVAAPDDGKFVQMDVGSWIILRFPGHYAAVPDGTAAADLRVDTFDAIYQADAEIFVSLDGSTWTSMGVYADTANIDLDLNGTGPVKYVKVDQNGHYIDPAYPTLGFDLDAVVALNAGTLLPDIEKELLEGPEQIEIYLPGPTTFVFEIAYSGPAAKVIDTVPAEFEILSLTSSAGTETFFPTNKGKGKGKSASRIEWDAPAGSNTLTVTIQTVASPGKGHKDGIVFKPTSIGPLPLNDGATAFEVDPDTGEIVREEVVDPDTGEVTLVPVVIVGPSNALVVEAVVQVD